MVLKCPFSALLHKKSPKCVSIPGILLFVNQKSYHFKTAQHLKRVEIFVSQGKKRRNTLCISSIFNAERLEIVPFRALLPYEVLPNQFAASDRVDYSVVKHFQNGYGRTTLP